MAVSQAEMLDGCRRKDPKSQRRLYEQFASTMLAVCHRYARSVGDAEDILQDGFVKVFQHIDRYDDRGSLEGWIRRIVINTAIDHLRKHKYQLQESEVNDAIHHESHAEDALDQLELATLFEIVQSLPDGYRITFNLYAVEGYSHAEIGEKLGITESTSRSQYTRARSLLRKRLSQVYSSVKIYKDVI